MINKIIKFSTSFCQPCKFYSPILQKYCEDNNIVLEEFDAEENNDLAIQYGIRNVPTTIFLQNDIILGKKVGTMTSKQIEEYIEEIDEDIIEVNI